MIVGMFLKKLPNVSILFESGRKWLTDKSVWLLQSSILSFNVINKSYRQVLTPVNNSQLLLKLVILDKFRLVTFHTLATQKKLQHKTDLHWFRRNKSSHDLDS